MRFVAFDLETTGTDPERDRVIQIAAVRVDGGRVTARWSRLVDPGMSVPLAIQRLTGITPERLAGQPRFEDILPEFLVFAAGSPLVAHNAPFDLGFLARALDRLGCPVPGPVYDSLELARLVLPVSRSHRLQSLVEELGLAREADAGRFHDALVDAEAAAAVFLKLLDRMRSLDLFALQTAQRMLATGKGPEQSLADLLDGAISEVVSEGSRPWPPSAKAVAQGGPERSRPEVGGGERRAAGFDPEELAALLAPGGALAAGFSSYERREGQLEMLRSAAAAFRDGSVLVAEAGTGTGKSMAYLVPALAWASANREKVVVTTHTIPLQEQIYNKDLPFLSDRLPFAFRTALVKGRGNYFCRLKWEEAVQDPASLPVAARRLYARLAVWMTETTEGDAAELNLRRDEEQAWSAVAVDGGCLGERCRHRQSCPYLAARRRAEEADLLVVNHALLMADLATGGNVLPAYKYLVCDEAHHLADVASQHLGLTVDEGELLQLLADTGGPGGRGLPTRLERTLLPVAAAADTFVQRLRRLEEGARAAMQVVGGLFAALREWAGRGQSGHGDHPLKTRRLPGLDGRDGWPEGWERVMAAGEEVCARLQDLSAEVSELGRHLANDAGALLGGGEDLLAELESRAGALGQAAAELAEILAAAADQEQRTDAAETYRVSWFEWDDRQAAGASAGGRLRAAPLFPGAILADRLWSRLEGAVLTSATLAVGGDFGHFLSQTGLDRLGERVRCLAVTSPFDYARQALLCIPRGLPEPRGDGDRFTESAAEYIGSLAGIAGGRTLVLFTANNMLRQVYFRLRPALEEQGILVLAQGLDGSRSRLTEQFLANPRTVLLGAASFWEGVDLPGDALRCVVLVRLPFRPPSVPLTEARLEALARAGEDGFRRLSLPEAVIRFRQGFGRLIRRAADRGAVVVLDPRLLGRIDSYGRVFLESLPGPRLCIGSKDEVLREFARWLEDDRFATFAVQR